MCVKPGICQLSFKYFKQYYFHTFLLYEIDFLKFILLFSFALVIQFHQHLFNIIFTNHSQAVIQHLITNHHHMLMQPHLVQIVMMQLALQLQIIVKINVDKSFNKFLNSHIRRHQIRG